MKQYQQGRVWNQIKYSFASIFLISILTIMLIKENLSLLDKYLRIKEVRDKAQKDLVEVDSKYEISTEKLKTISTVRGVDGYIRQAYPVVKNGEEVITLYNSSTTNIINVNISPSIWDRFYIWLKEAYDNAIIDYTNKNK